MSKLIMFLPNKWPTLPVGGTKCSVGRNNQIYVCVMVTWKCTLYAKGIVWVLRILSLSLACTNICQLCKSRYHLFEALPMLLATTSVVWSAGVWAVPVSFSLHEHYPCHTATWWEGIAGVWAVPVSFSLHEHYPCHTATWWEGIAGVWAVPVSFSLHEHYPCHTTTWWGGGLQKAEHCPCCQCPHDGLWGLQTFEYCCQCLHDGLWGLQKYDHCCQYLHDQGWGLQNALGVGITEVWALPLMPTWWW